MFLEINQIRKSYGSGESRVEVLKGIDLYVEQGEFCVLPGPSGSGKSTLLNIIGGIDQADSGDICIRGERMADMKEKKLTLYRRKHLGYIFQMYNLIPNLTVRENVEVGAYLSEKPLDVDELLHTLGLYDHRNKLPNQLSGGQQQRTAIGRAIVKNPDILLCDEPTGALDYNTSKEILKLIEKVNQKYGNTVIMVTHNDAIKDMADRVVRLRDGMIRKNYLNEQKLSADALDVFMSREALNDMFDLGSDYFCGYFSNSEITDIDSKYIGSLIDIDDLTRISRQLDQSMGSMMYLIDGFAVLIFVVLMYLLSKIIIEKNAQSISMNKILGYTNSEISRLYIISTFIVVAVSILISMPLVYEGLVYIFRWMLINSMSEWIPIYLGKSIYVKMFIMGVVSYGVVALLEYRRIQKIPMDTALKNVE